MTSLQEQEKINDFLRSYADRSFRADINHIKINASPEHNKRVCDICCGLRENNIPFFTEFITNFGLRFDICTPTHVVKFIEVLHNETVPDFIAKKLPKVPFELRDSFILNDTQDKLDINQVL